MSKDLIDLVLTDNYNPTLYVTGFIQNSLNAVINEWLDWYEKKLGYTVVCSPVKGDFPGITRSALNPLRRISDNKILLLPSADHQWVGAFTNRFPVADRGAVRYVGSHLGSNHLSVSDIPAPHGEQSIQIYESRQFLYRYYEQGVEHERVVVASQQGERSWVFDVQGDPLPFEDTSLYQQRSIKKRLTSDTLYLYMKALGIDMFAPGYFAGEGILIEFENPRVK